MGLINKKYRVIYDDNLGDGFGLISGVLIEIKFDKKDKNFIFRFNTYEDGQFNLIVDGNPLNPIKELKARMIVEVKEIN